MRINSVSVRYFLLALSWVLLVCGTTPAAMAQVPCTQEWQAFDASTTTFPGVNGTVNATIMWDPDGAGPITPKLVIGGRFSAAVNVVAANIAIYDPATGNWSALGSGLTRVTGSLIPEIFALAVLPSGDLIAGGQFDIAGGVPASGIARWDGTSWSALGSGVVTSFGGLPAGGTVYALAVLPSGDLVAGGSFFSAGGVSARNIARWNGASWSALGSGTSGGNGGIGLVFSLAVLPNGNLVGAGDFTAAGGVAANNIATWNGSSWSTLGSGVTVQFGFGSPILALAVTSTGDLIAGGNFTTAGGVAARNIARWNGTSWAALGSGVGLSGSSQSVIALAVLPSGDLVAGGNFSTAGGVAVNRIARWNGVSWAALGSGVNNTINALAVFPGGDLFTVSAGGIARWNGSSWSLLGSGLPGFLSPIRTLTALPGGDLISGGVFSSAAGVPANHIARWNGASWSALGSGVAFPGNSSVSVNALAVLSGGDLIAGGSFTMAGGVAASNIARWNGASWATLGSGVGNFGVAALAVLPNGDLIAGGGFTTAGGVAASNIARWNGTAWAPLGSGMSISSGSSVVRALAVLPNGDLIVGGRFTTAGGIPANNIARWNGVSWSALGSGLAFQGNSSVQVNALAVLLNGDIIAGGSFITAGGQTANRIARWNGISWSPLGFGMNLDVDSLAVLPSGVLVAGGSFTLAGSVFANGIARWNGASWSALGSGFNSGPVALAILSSGDLIAGGNFSSSGAVVTPYLARYRAVIAGVVTQALPQSILAGQALALSATAAPTFTGVTIQWQRNGVNLANGPGGASLGGGTVSGASGALPSPTDGTPITLTITGAQVSDAGTYAAIFTNECGSSTSLAAAIIRDPASCSLADFVGGNGNPPADGSADGDDFQSFLNAFSSGNALADLVGGDGNPPADGSVDGNDFQAFLNAFAAGC